MERWRNFVIEGLPVAALTRRNPSEGDPKFDSLCVGPVAIVTAGACVSLGWTVTQFAPCPRMKKEEK